MVEGPTPPWHTIDIDRYSEPTGVLSVLETTTQIPFSVERVFWVNGVPENSIERGAHAHQELNQVLFCAQGACKLKLESNRGEKEIFELSQTSVAIFLKGHVWRTMYDFSSDCSLVVLCDRPYHEDRVITDYNEFLALKV